MPSQENLKHKQAVINEIGEKMEKASGVVILDYIGISVDEANAMRIRLREAGVDYKVYKNTLVRRAIEGTSKESLIEALSGPSAFAFGYEDATAPARVLDGVIKDFKKMEFKAGLIEGTFYDAICIKQIATIPSREVLIAKFLGSIQSPIGKLVRTFAAIADAGGEAADEPAAANIAEAAPADEAIAEPVQDAIPAEETAAPKEAAEEEAAPPEDTSTEEAAAEEAAPPEEAAAEEAASPEEVAPPEEADAEEAAPPEETAAEEAASQEDTAAEEAPVEE